MELTDALAKLEVAVRATEPELVTAVAAALSEETARLDPEVERELRPLVQALAARVTSAMLRSLSESRRLTDLELEAIRSAGGGRIADALQPFQLLRLYNAAQHAIHARLLRAVRSLQMNAQARLRLIGLVGASVLGLSSQLKASVFELQLEAGRRHSIQIDRGDDAVGELLHGTVSDTQTRALSRAGITLGTYHAVAVIDATALEKPRQLVEKLRVLPAEGSYHPIVDLRGQHVVVIQPLAEPRPADEYADLLRPLLEEFATDGRVAAGVQVEGGGRSGVGSAYRRALRALEVPLVARGLEPVITYERGLPYLLLLADPSLATDVYRATIEPLDARNAAEAQRLVATLEAYLSADGNVAEAAEQLGVHRHTLYGRLERIEALAGRSPTTRMGRLQFDLGLRARRLLRG